MNPTVVEHIFSQTFEVDKVSTITDTSFPSYSFPSYGPPAVSHLGETWRGCARYHKSALGVFLWVTSPLKKDTTITYGVRFINGDHEVDIPSKSITIAVGAMTLPGYARVMLWSDLLAKFCVDGKFTVQFVFPEPAKVDVDERGIPPMTLDGAVFKNVWVACEGFDDEKVHCNKCIIAGASEAILSAFSNETSKESLTSTFTIGHPNATAENVRLIVKAMYEGWLKEEMDEHADDIFAIADCYRCERIVGFAVQSLNRQLSPERFWKTASAAVKLRESRPSLFEYCIKYADGLSGGVNDVLNRDDVGNVAKDTIIAVVFAVAALHKK